MDRQARQSSRKDPGPVIRREEYDRIETDQLSKRVAEVVRASVFGGSVVVALIDNLLYPIFVGNKLRLHTLLVFIAIGSACRATYRRTGPPRFGRARFPKRLSTWEKLQCVSMESRPGRPVPADGKGHGPPTGGRQRSLEGAGLLQKVSKDTKDSDVKQLAAQMLPVVNRHLAESQSMSRNGGKTP